MGTAHVFNSTLFLKIECWVTSNHHPPSSIAPSTPQYRRAYTPGSTVFLTLVTYNRTSIFANPQNISYLRSAVATVRSELPFEITAAVVLPDHLHFLWTLPANDSDYSKRVGRLKVLFTRSL